MDLRILNSIVEHDASGAISKYNISADNNSVDGTSINASISIKPNEIDLTPILEVCKKKLQETVSEKGV
ncbi:MAG: hypothetical protein LKF42_08645 [Streptococcaceae bacterium]|jgi:hypothetical protein|nr:hypothetical protein [Streptococcaceae bacterium]MCH4177309.1 hypothetical protein [Streptococcaceae bacterium]